MGRAVRGQQSGGDTCLSASLLHRLLHVYLHLCFGNVLRAAHTACCMLLAAIFAPSPPLQCEKVTVCRILASMYQFGLRFFHLETAYLFRKVASKAMLSLCTPGGREREWAEGSHGGCLELSWNDRSFIFPQRNSLWAETLVVSMGMGMGKPLHNAISHCISLDVLCRRPWVCSTVPIGWLS